MNQPFTQKEIIQQKIIEIEAKPREFSPEQKKKKEILEKILKSLNEKWKDFDINDEQYSAIGQKIKDLNTQLNSLQSEIFTQTDQKLLEHYQRILNPNPLTPEQKTEIKDQKKEERKQKKYQGNTQDYQTWPEYEATLTKDKIKVLELPRKTIFYDETGNYKERLITFPDNKLVIKQEDYPNLKVLHANNYGLKSVELASDTLTHLYLNGNELENIDLSKVPNLEALVISNNKLKSLEVTHLRNLKKLWCFKNCLLELDCDGMKELEELNCAQNVQQFIIINQNNGKIIKYHERISNLSLEGCSNIKTLDADLNELDKQSLDFSHLTKLERISVRQNSTQQDLFEKEDGSFGVIVELPRKTKSLIFWSSYLEHIDTKFSDVKEIINKGVTWDPKNPQPFLATLNNPSKFRIIDKNNCEIYWINQGNEISHPTQWEQDEIENQQQKEKEAFEKGEHVWAGQEQLDLSNRDYINSITIDGDIDYPKSLTSINLGGNYLSEVIVRNMPNLVRLIVSHNSGLIKGKTLIIENCPKLQLLYNYKSGDEDRVAPEDAQEYQEETDNPFKKEQENQTKLLAQIIRLIGQAETALQNKNYPKLDRLIKQIKQLSEQEIPGLNKVELEAKMNKWEQACLVQENINEPRNYWLIVIGSVVILPIILAIFILLVKRWITTNAKSKVK